MWHEENLLMENSGKLREEVEEAASFEWKEDLQMSEKYG